MEPVSCAQPCDLGIDSGWSDFEQVAWVRGLLQARFGAPSSQGDEYKSTFEYVLRVNLDDARPVHVLIHDSKGELRCATGDALVPDERREQAIRALRRQLAGISPADYQARFLHHDLDTQYGCHHGAPFVLDFGPARLEVEPAVMPERTPTDAELEAFYARTAPPGSPPLGSIREHVIAAYAAAHRVVADDQLAARAAALSLTVVSWANRSIDLVAAAAGHAALSSIMVQHAQRWDAPSRLVAWVRTMIARLDGWLDDGVKKPVVPHNRLLLGSHAYVWRAVRAELQDLVGLLVEIEAGGRRCHLLPPPRDPPPDLALDEPS